MAARFGLFLSVLLLGYSTATVRAETPEEWASVLSRVHGGFGSFLPVGIRIGEDAMKRLNAKPRELSVLFYQGEATPCPCASPAPEPRPSRSHPATMLNGGGTEG